MSRISGVSPALPPPLRNRSEPGTAAVLALLLIEDNPGDARLIREMLRDTRLAVEVDRAETLAEGLLRIETAHPDVVLLDLTLPDSCGLDTFHRVSEHARRIPIIVLTGLDDERLAEEAVHAGAQDYLVKGAVDGNLLGRSIRYAIERKRSEAALQETNDQLRRAQRIAQLGSWQWDVADNAVHWSEELHRIYGLEPHEFEARFEAYLALVHPEDRSRVRETIEAALRDHSAFSFEERIVRRDGSVRILHSQGQVLLDARGRPAKMVGVCQDVTERKRSEAELARARDAALQSARLKSAFLANMSHEIRTPLNIILGYNDVVADHFALLDEEHRRDLVEGVRRAGERLLATINGILDLSKIETGNFEVHPETIALCPVIHRQIEDFQMLAKDKRLRLSAEIHESDAAVRFDEYCLTHALMNLLQNAIKFTEEGRVTVGLGRDPQDALCLSVEDTGIGIDSSYLPRLFQRFSQEEFGYTRRFEGSGLGLTLTKEYVELNGARLSVESEKGRGSIFRIHFPKETGPQRPVEQVPGSGGRAGGRSEVE